MRVRNSLQDSNTNVTLDLCDNTDVDFESKSDVDLQRTAHVLDIILGEALGNIVLSSASDIAGLRDTGRVILSAMFKRYSWFEFWYEELTHRLRPCFLVVWLSLAKSRQVFGDQSSEVELCLILLCAWCVMRVSELMSGGFVRDRDLRRPVVERGCGDDLRAEKSSKTNRPELSSWVCLFRVVIWKCETEVECDMVTQRLCLRGFEERRFVAEGRGCML